MAQERPVGVEIAYKWTRPAAAVGDAFMLSEFTARFDQDGLPLVALDIAVMDGTPLCRGVHVTPRPEGPGITGQELKRIPIASWMRQACRHAAVPKTLGEVGLSFALAASDAEREELDRSLRRRHRRLTDEFLREVAAVYSDFLDDSPVEAVKAKWPTSYSSAARWVSEARARGFLPPSGRKRKPTSRTRKGTR
jgi:hypothetical protein